MLLKTSPVLASLNFSETLEFYKSIGFKNTYLDNVYCIMMRDQISLHFWKCKNNIHPENTSCYIYVNEIDKLYKEIENIKAIHPNGNISDTEYGIREFSMLDIHGNLIRFGKVIK